jgi:DNA-binding NarL/FixJ family response regulator
LIVDEHPVSGAGVIAALRTIFGSVEVIEAKTLAAALAELRDGKPFNVILVDLVLPDAEGTAGISALATAVPRLPVVVITTADNPRDRHGAIAAGARGCIPKSSAIGMLKSALLLVLPDGLLPSASRFRQRPIGEQIIEIPPRASQAW